MRFRLSNRVLRGVHHGFPQFLRVQPEINAQAVDVHVDAVLVDPKPLGHRILYRRPVRCVHLVVRAVFPSDSLRFVLCSLPLNVLVLQRSHVRLRAFHVLVPRCFPRSLVALQLVLPLNLPPDHLFHGEAFIRRGALQLFQLGDVILAPETFPLAVLLAAFLHRDRQRLTDLLSPEPGEHHRGRPLGFRLVAFGASVAGLRVEAQHRGFLVVV